jgi:hypothetical protein
MLLHWIDGQTFANDPWIPSPLSGVRDDGTELRALDSDGTTAWAVGGVALSSTSGGGPPRQPVVVRYDGEQWLELPVADAGTRAGEFFNDVAAVPGTKDAWATLATSSPAGDSEQPRLAFIAGDGTVTVQELARAGDPLRGAATRVDCPAADDCWMVTSRGYLYRWGGHKDYLVDTDPAFQGTIAERPNEGAAQFLPEAPPDDDSRLFAPPVEIPAEDPEPPRTCRRPPRLMSGVRDPDVRPMPGARARDTARGASDAARARFTLTVKFRLARRARVALIAERRPPATRRGRQGRSGRRVTHVVARTRLRTLRPGHRSLNVTVSRAAWPTGLRFVLREAGRVPCVLQAETASRSAGDR